MERIQQKAKLQTGRQHSMLQENGRDLFLVKILT